MHTDSTWIVKNIRLKICTAKFKYGDFFSRRIFRTANFLEGESSYSEISLRRNLLMAKLPYGEISYGEDSGHVYFGLNEDYSNQQNQ